jgi:phytanoyl-CoA hydroxylase
MIEYSFEFHPEQSLHQYNEIGLHLEKNLIDTNTCNELIAIANELPAYKLGDCRSAMQMHLNSNKFMDVISNIKIVSIMRQLIGEKISAIHSQFYYGEPGTPGFQPHQDNRFVNAPVGQFASAWIALTDVSKENGGLYIYPKTHLEPLLEVEEVSFEESLLQDRNALRLRCKIPANYNFIDLTMPKGSCAFFDGNTVHGSYRNESKQNRYALLITYIRRGAPFVSGQHAKRKEIPID